MCDVMCHNKYRRKKKKSKEMYFAVLLQPTLTILTLSSADRTFPGMLCCTTTRLTARCIARYDPGPPPPQFLQDRIVRSSRRSLFLVNSSLPRKRRENLASSNYDTVLLGSLLRTLEGTGSDHGFDGCWVIKSPAF